MNRDEATTLVWRLEGTYGVAGLTGAARSAWIQRRKEIEQQIIDALCEDKWIPIPDILPEPYKDFLVWMPLEDPPIEIGYFTHELGGDLFRGEECFPLSSVTHYQPLPEGPREED